jgi:hypothetical protein
MTEQEWLASREPKRMADFLLGRDHGSWSKLARWLGVADEQPTEGLERRISDRKLRLFACACCFPLCNNAKDGRSLDALRYSYDFADGSVDEETLDVARSLAWEAVNSLPVVPIDSLNMTGGSWKHYVWLARAAAETASEAAADAAVNALHAVMQAAIEWGAIIDNPAIFVPTYGAKALAALVREIAGNPFHCVRLDPAWRWPEVLALAHAIYDDRAFDRLPVLADALEEAGCTDPDILEHLRSPGPHVRGCWAVDLILSKG